MISIGHNINNPYAQYGLDHFLFKYGIKAGINQAENPDVVISYGNSIESKGRTTIQILSNEIKPGIAGYFQFGNETVPLFEIPEKLDVTAENKVLATFQSDSDSYPCVITNDNNVIIGFDVFNEVGQILSGYLEPIFWKQTDESERLMRIPVVDILEEFLFGCLQDTLFPNGVSLESKPFWPDGKKFALVLTHDVDRTYKTYQYIPSLLKDIRKGNLTGAVEQVKSLLFKYGKSNPYWTFDNIMALENELEVKSTFFFLNESGRLNPFSLKSWILFGGRYKIDSPDVAGVIKMLHRSGFEIGVHGSYHSYKDSELLKAEKEKLESLVGAKIHGVRQHYLNFDPKNTFRIQELVGFEYDSTLGFTPQIGVGFRRGTCFPFHPISPNGLRSPLLEIPLIIMDGGLPTRDTFGDCAKILSIVERYGGALTLLWHQRMFSEGDFPNMTKIYRQLIEIAQSRNAWVTNTSEIQRWWESRQNPLPPEDPLSQMGHNQNSAPNGEGICE